MRQVSGKADLDLSRTAAGAQEVDGADHLCGNGVHLIEAEHLRSFTGDGELGPGVDRRWGGCRGLFAAQSAHQRRKGDNVEWIAAIVAINGGTNRYFGACIDPHGQQHPAWQSRYGWQSLTVTQLASFYIDGALLI